MGRFRGLAVLAIAGWTVAAGLASGAGAAPNVSQQSFGSCEEAAAAGFTNITSGQPGYALALDRDKDGIACDETAAPMVAAPPAPSAQVQGATAAAPATAAPVTDTLAQTGSSSWILLLTALVLFMAGKRLISTGYELLAWIPGRRHSQVRFTMEPRRRRRRR